MGSEVKCVVRSGQKKSAGIAQLESEEIRFKGDWKLRIAFKEIVSIKVMDGELHLGHSDGETVFTLGATAEKWASKIRSPKGLLDKLGIKPDSQVLVLEIDDKEFQSQLRERLKNPKPSKGPYDLVIFGLSDKKELAKLPGLQKKIAPNGCIWAVWPKGKPQLKEDDVRAAAKAIGLVDVKVAKFSESHSALKLVIPVAKR